MAMELTDLAAFEAVAEAGAMGRAAEALDTVQSNVTARIRKLETELGASLFHRHARGVELTAAGRALLPYAARIRRLCAEAREAAGPAAAPRGPLAIGSLETTAAARLPPLLASFHAAWPQVELSLRTGTTAELLREVLRWRLDGAFVAGPVRHAELTEERVFEEELALVTPAGARRPEDVLSRPELTVIVFRTGCSYRQRLEAWLADKGLAGLRRIELGTLEGILGCIGAGMGFTLLPRAAVERAALPGAVRLHAIEPHYARVSTMFVRRSDAEAGAALRRFLEHCRKAPGRSEAPPRTLAQRR
jgi:LysR family transcriptional regulator, cell division regulator